MESDTMELLRLMLAHLRPRLQGRDEEWQALEQKQEGLMASFREAHGGDAPPTSSWGCKWAWTWGS